ncbi:MAG: Arc family DNA-binding protein [Spirochaetes bacterium]|nr:Arc family DNA-binding protein [Spirochaetota bacterium]
MTATLSLKEVPATTHRALKDRAAMNHRSLNGEILAILEAAVRSQNIDAQATLSRARELRGLFSGKITEADLFAAKRMGRA